MRYASTAAVSKNRRRFASSQYTSPTDRFVYRVSPVGRQLQDFPSRWHEHLHLAGFQDNVDRGGCACGNAAITEEPGISNHPDLARAASSAIAVGDGHMSRSCVDVSVENDCSGKWLTARVGDDQHFAIDEDARERHDAAGSEGVPEVHAVAGNLTKIKPPVAQRRMAVAELR